MSRPVFVTTVLVGVLLTVAVARLPAKQTAPAQTELLAEVRLLRQAIESLAGTNARVQIVFGRLQLQEQRVEAAAKRLDAARDALAKLTRAMADMAEDVKDLENRQSDSRRKPEDIEQARRQATMLTRELERSESTRARLAGDEAEAASLLNQEQGRWSDLNRQLDELERALTKQ